jgi:hypothetical protein
MSELPTHLAGIESLERQQDDVLRRLDELNRRIERVLAQQGGGPPAANSEPVAAKAA